VNLAPEIRSYVCGNGGSYVAKTHGNRIYGLRLNDLSGDPARPWSEANITDITSTTLGTIEPLKPVSTLGWYLRLEAGEKVNNPADILQGTVYFTTYRPTGACDTITSTSTISCASPSGTGKLYLMNYLTGQPPNNFTFKGSNALLYSGVQLGAGVPTAPAVSVGMGLGRASAAMLISTSQDPTPVAIRGAARQNLVDRILKLLVPQDIHKTLRDAGSAH